jgi:hypothetical protein
MRNLKQDTEEMDTPEGARWVRRVRRRAGIAPTEGAAWLAVTELRNVGEEFARDLAANDHNVVDLGRSPGDVLHTAALHATNARQGGFGSWTLETYGGGEGRLVLTVKPVWDEEYYLAEEAHGNV